MLAPARRGTFLVLMGAFLVSIALTIGVAVRGPTPMAVSAPEPVVPTSDTPTSDTPPPTAPEEWPTDEPTHSESSTTTPSTTTSSPPPSTAPTERDQPAAGFQAVAGPACPVNASRDVRISAGWQVVPGDSWTGDGCGNRFLYSAPDDENHVQWRFTLDDPADRTCRIAVFVPDSGLASSRVWYGITDQFTNADHRVGGFSLDQKANRGRWVNAATISNDTGTLLVNLNGDQGLTGVTAGPLRVACTEKPKEP
jgi:hypothetical protein